jgi:hypothetical protein
MPRDHVFRIMGKRVPWRYTQLRGQADGWAVIPDPQRPHTKERVLINERLTGRARLETEIHEFLHVAYPTHSEEHVTAAARDLARMLHALGYRLTHEG